jgi:hypothetical protein
MKWPAGSHRPALHTCADTTQARKPSPRRAGLVACQNPSLPDTGSGPPFVSLGPGPCGPVTSTLSPDSTTRSPRSPRRSPGRRHPRRHEARPARPLPARRQGHHRRPHQTEREAQHRRIHPRPHRPRRTTPLQRPGHGRRIRIRPHPRPHPRRHASRQAKGRLRGKQPKLTKTQEAHLVSLYKGGQHTTTEIAELFKVARSTVYRIVQRTP